MAGHTRTLQPDQITVTADQLGREQLVIPDAVATYMVGEIRRDWEELLGLADGQSRRFKVGTVMYDLTALLLSTYANSAIPEGLRDADHAERSRQSAANGADLRVSVVGKSGWDPETRWWRDYKRTRDLHLPGRAYADDHDGERAYHWRG